ncbi:MAG TPA: ketoacyl-ACP synthase III [Pirellulales bacterium]|nr:ketoacyl-ACP synthase III [Pirellulales bacterium]
MKYAAIGPISVYLPLLVETNDDLNRQFPKWDMDLIYSKTGIRARHIAAPEECASDLGVAAAEKLFAEHQVDRDSIDFLLLCTQTPDYPLPTTSCLMQDRLALRTSIGALDFNLGCSGFVYGLSLADGLIRSGAARRVLLITAETYSKYIAPDDRSLRTIFGDGAAATLVEAADTCSVGSFRFGTDGAGADTLMVTKGGARPENDAIKPRKRQRWSSDLFMDGPALVDFTVERIPQLVDEILATAQWARDEVDLFLMHQATHMMLDRLRQRMELDDQRLPLMLENCGNTVSSTLPILMHDLRASGRLRPGTRSLLVGFGVGLSWAGCQWTETWAGHGAATGDATTASDAGEIVAGDDDAEKQAA